MTDPNSPTPAADDARTVHPKGQTRFSLSGSGSGEGLAVSAGVKISIRRALIAYSVVVLLLIALLAASGLVLLWEVRQTRQEGEELANAMLLSSRVLADVAQAVSYLRDISLTGNLDSAARARGRTAHAIALLEEDALPGRTEQAATLTRKIEQVQRLGEDMARAYLTRGREAGNGIMNRPETGFEALAGSVVGVLGNMSAEARESLRANANALAKTGRQAERITTAIAVLSLLLVPPITLLLYRKLVGPVRDMVAVVNRVARGDTNARCRLQTRDELQVLGDAFDHMLNERVERMSDLDSSARALDEQNRRMSRMRTPVSQIWDGILFLPLVGTVNAARAQEIMDITLPAIRDAKARALIMDISGVPVVDADVAAYLVKVSRAASLMGCECITSGVSPAIAHTIVDLGIDVGQLTTTANLRGAITDAYARRGLRVAAEG